MIKFKQGAIKNFETGEKKDIVVKAASSNNLKEILIGGGLIITGVIYIAKTAFKNGSKKFEEAKFKTLSDLGLIGNTDSDGCTNNKPYILE